MRLTGKRVTFNDFTGFLVIGEYDNGNTYLEIQDPETEDYVTITTNIAYTLPRGQVYVKNYSENEGMLKQMMKQQVLSKPVSEMLSGLVTIPICRLLIEE